MIRLDETESILEFENNESGNLFHSLLTISTATDFKVHAASSDHLIPHHF